MTPNPAIAAAKADTPDGCCIACDAPLPEREPGKVGRNPIVCRDPECIRTYHAIYDTVRSERRRLRREQQEQAEADAERATAPRCGLCARLADEPHKPSRLGATP